MSGRLMQADLAEHWARWEYARDARVHWDRESTIDRDYEAGKIWTPDEMAVFESRKQPAVRFQLIRRAVNLVCGIEAQTRSDLRALPRVPRAVESAEAATKILKLETDQMQFARHMSRAFHDTAITGAGFLELGLSGDPAAHPIFGRRVAPELVYEDPATQEPDWSDALDVFRALWMRTEDLARMFPRWRKDLLGMVGTGRRNDYARLSHSSDYANAHNGEPPKFPQYSNGYNHGQATAGSSEWTNGIDRREGLVQAVERWYRTWDLHKYVKYRDGRVSWITEQNHQAIAADIQAQKCSWPTDGLFCQIRVAVFVHGLLLSDAASPYDHGMFPIVPIWAYKDEHGAPCGIVRAARDPQKEYAARRASLMKRAMSGPRYFGSSSQFPDMGKARRQLMSGDPIVDIEDSAGYPQAIDTAQANAVDEAMVGQAQQMVYDSVGITQELLGVAGAAKSGTAIERLQAQGQTALFSLFDNRNWAHETFGRMLMSVVAKTYTDEQEVRVTDSGRVSFVAINKRRDDGGVDNDVTQEAFDITLSLEAQTSTTQLAQLEALNGYLANAPEPIKLAFGPQIARLMSLPNAAETIPMIERLTEQLLSQIFAPAQPVPGAPPGAALPGSPSPLPGGASAPASPEPGPLPPATAA